MTKKNVYQMGFERGFCFASWQDLPEVGSVVKPFNVPNFIGTVETVNDACDLFFELAQESESNAHQYDDFAIIAHELNELSDYKPYDVWDVFENGIDAGIRKNWNSRKSFYNDAVKRRRIAFNNHKAGIRI